MNETEFELRLQEERAKMNEQVESIMDSVILGLATVVESRDNSTGGHIRRTSECVRLFMDHLKQDPDFDYISDSYLTLVAKAAPMHDLGKLAVPDAVLQKQGKFTDEEYALMKTHSKAGARLVYEVLSETPNQEFLNIAVNVAYYHHEKWNGTGYPTGISGEDIPFEARIMALADVFDALVSKRCYKDSFSYDKAFSIIEESLGSHFDPVLGRKFLEYRPYLEELYDRLLKEYE